MHLNCLECFGYTADIHPHTNEKVKLVHLSQTTQSGEDMWIDRFDIQLLLEDPTVIWDTDRKHTNENQVLKKHKDSFFEEYLNKERYHDLVPNSILHYPQDASFIIPSATAVSYHNIQNVPTAKELSQYEIIPNCITKPISNNHSKQQSLHVSLPIVTKQYRLFKPYMESLNKIALEQFLNQVKSRHTCTGLPLHNFWPSSLQVHLSIEFTATLLNKLPCQAEEELNNFVFTIKDEDRLALGFLSKWHSLYPYFCLIRTSKYHHGQHFPKEIPFELRSLFLT